VPTVTVRVGLHRYVWHRLHAAGTGAKVVSAALVIFFFSGAGFIAARRWLSGRKSATPSPV
jgi:hypothetical protein